MRHKSTELMNQIKAFAEQFYFDNGRSPSTTEIANEVGIARGTAHRYLVDMGQRGLISYRKGVISTDKMDLLSPDNSAEVYSGAIPCGPLDTVEATLDGYVKLPVSIFGKGELYVICTNGDSMVEAGIDSGDYVVVQKNVRAEEGDIVVALSNNDNSLKRLMWDEECQSFYLHPENKHLEDIYVEDLDIQGVARYVIKAL